MKRKAKNEPVEIMPRQEPVEKRQTGEDHLPYEWMEDYEQRRMILSAIEQQSFKSKACVLLFYFEKMNYEEIARALHITPKAVDNALTRARSSMVSRFGREPRLRTFLNRTYAAVGGPLLEQVLRVHVREVITEDSHRRFMHLGSELIAGTANVTGVPEEWVTQEPAGSGAGTIAKVIVGTTLTAGLIAAGAGIMISRQEQGTEPISITDRGEAAGIQMPPADGEADEEEKEIRTLEDMIGEEEAEMLRGYSGLDGMDRRDAEEFLEEIGMTLTEGVWNPISRIEYTSYLRTRQERMLIVIIRNEVDIDRCGLVFHFTDADDMVPNDFIIPISYEDWNEL